MTPPASPLPHQPSDGTLLDLRLLETTDVHANLFDYDYHSDRPVEHYGLVRTATLIRQARDEVTNALLFDNGDFLQGTPLSDIVAQRCSAWHGKHPVITAMNALGYDAASLGNHEFNFGLDVLQEALAQASFPVTCGNAMIHPAPSSGHGSYLLPPYLLLRRLLTDRAGKAHELTIGVLGLVPPQVEVWDQFHLSDRIRMRGILESARELIPKMRADGADLVIVLAHTGMSAEPESPRMENAALPLSRLPGVDAVLAGHLHQVFPLHADDRQPEGTAPIVMAGFRGSHLGVLDLVLSARGGHWQVIGAQGVARPVVTEKHTAPPDPALSELLLPAHNATLEFIRHELGQISAPLHSYFALVAPSDAVQLVNDAKRSAACEILAGCPEQALPLLTASASFKTGGRGGPHYYTDVAAGSLFLRHAADLYPFPNLLCIARITGAELRDWLERAAAVFHQIAPRDTPQRLHVADIPGHVFDVVDGVSYEIDLSHPALYDGKGRRVSPGPGRIRALCHEGTAVTDDQRFLIVTNNYRAYGGGPYEPLRDNQLVHISKTQVVDLLIRHLKSATPIEPAHASNWRLAPLPGAEVWFDTGPGARAYPEAIAALGAVDTGDTDEGFARFRLRL